jgi:hypothetical protein
VACLSICTLPNSSTRHSCFLTCNIRSSTPSPMTSRTARRWQHCCDRGSRNHQWTYCPSTVASVRLIIQGEKQREGCGPLLADTDENGCDPRHGGAGPLYPRALPNAGRVGRRSAMCQEPTSEHSDPRRATIPSRSERDPAAVTGRMWGIRNKNRQEPSARASANKAKVFFRIEARGVLSSLTETRLRRRPQIAQRTRPGSCASQDERDRLGANSRPSSFRLITAKLKLRLGSSLMPDWC